MFDSESYAFMKELASRIGGHETDVWGDNSGVKIYFRGLMIYFAPDKNGPRDSNGTWSAEVYTDEESDRDRIINSSIPNTCRDLDRVVDWIESVKADIKFCDTGDPHATPVQTSQQPDS